MNVQLYNDLNKAYSFLEYDEREFVPKLQAISQRIEALRAIRIPYPKTPHELQKKNQAMELILLLFVWPVGLWYIFKNKKERTELIRQANEQYVRETAEFNRRLAELNQQIAAEQAKYDEVAQVRNQYYQREGHCLSFLPENFRRLRTVGIMKHYVNNGMADTLKEAMNLAAKELREMEERRVAYEEAKLAEQRHKETIDAIDRTKDALDRQTEEIKQANDMYRDYRRRHP